MIDFIVAGARLVAVDQAGRAHLAWEGPYELLKDLELMLAESPALAAELGAACGLQSGDGGHRIATQEETGVP